MDSLGLVVAGVAFTVFGFVGARPGTRHRRVRRSARYARGVQAGSYSVMAAGAVLVVAGVVTGVVTAVLRVLA